MKINIQAVLSATRVERKSMKKFKRWLADILCDWSHTGSIIAYKLGIAEEGRHFCTLGQEGNEDYAEQ